MSTIIEARQPDGSAYPSSERCIFLLDGIQDVRPEARGYFAEFCARYRKDGARFVYHGTEVPFDPYDMASVEAFREDGSRWGECRPSNPGFPDWVSKALSLNLRLEYPSWALDGPKAARHVAKEVVTKAVVDHMIPPVVIGTAPGCTCGTVKCEGPADGGQCSSWCDLKADLGTLMERGSVDVQDVTISVAPDAKFSNVGPSWESLAPLVAGAETERMRR